MRPGPVAYKVWAYPKAKEGAGEPPKSLSQGPPSSSEGSTRTLGLRFAGRLPAVYPGPAHLLGAKRGR